MDRIAVISDIHGNLPALDAVLADIQTRKIEKIYCLGDMTGKGPDSARVVDICRKRCTGAVLGNWDDMIAKGKEEELFLWHRDRLGGERLDYLNGLPGTINLQMSGRYIRLFHSSNQGVHHRVFPYKAYKELVAMFANTNFTGNDIPAPDIIGYGDIHLAYTLTLFSNHKTIYNTGSVGCPADEPTASYAILEGVLDSKEKGSFSINIVRLPYDIELAVSQAVEAGVPQLENHVVELRTAVYRGLQNG